jgi:hypothetical protein
MGKEESLAPDGGEKLIPGPAPLTPREEAFCVAFGDPESLHYGRPTKAAVAAGYPEKSAWNTAWKLRRRPRIIARLGEFQAAAKAVAAKVLTDLENTRLLALEKGDLAVAARCSELQGKHIGMFYERNVLTLDSPGTYDPIRAQEARRITAILLMNPALGLPPGTEAPAAAAPASLLQNAPPARATLEQIERAQAPCSRQGE